MSTSIDVSVMNDALLNDEPPCESIVITFVFFSRIWSMSASQNALLSSSDRPSRSSLKKSYAPYFSSVSASFFVILYASHIAHTPTATSVLPSERMLCFSGFSTALSSPSFMFARWNISISYVRFVISRYTVTALS